MSENDHGNGAQEGSGDRFGPPGPASPPDSSSEPGATASKPTEEQSPTEAPQVEEAGSEPTPSIAAPVPPLPPAPEAPSVAVPTVSIPRPKGPIGAQIARIATGEGLATLAILLGITIGVGLVSALLVEASISIGAGETGLSPFSTLMILTGWSLGGGLSMGLGSYGSIFILVLPWGTFLGLAVLLAFAAYRRRSVDGTPPNTGPVLVRGAVEGAVVALVVTLVTAFFSVGTSDPFSSDQFRLRSAAAMTFIMTLLIVFGATSVGRLWGSSRVVAPSKARVIMSALVKEFLQAHVALVIAFAVVGVVASIIFAVSDGAASALLLLPILLPTLVVWEMGVGFLGGIAVSLGGLGDFSDALSDLGVSGASQLGGTHAMLAWDLGGWGWILIVVALLGILVSALRVGVRRVRSSTVVWRRVWQLPVVTFVVWLVIGLGLCAIRGSGQVSILGRASVSAGLSWWTPFTVAIGMGIVSVLAEFLPAIAYGAAPGLLAALGGRQATNQWLSGGGDVALGGIAPADAVSTAPAPPTGWAATGSPLHTPVPTAPASTGSVPASPAQTPGLFQPDANAVPPVPVAQFPQQASAAPVDGVAPAPALPAPKPMSPATKRALIIGASAVAAVGVVVAAGAITIGVINGQRTPEAAVREYVDLIAEGRADAATAMVDPGLPNDQRTLLTDAVLSGSSSKIEVIDVKETSVPGAGGFGFNTGRARTSATPDKYVDVTLSLDGQRFTTSLGVARGDNEKVFLHTWTVTDALVVPVSLSADGFSSVDFAGSEVQLDEQYGVGSSQLYAYPGIYQVAAPSDNQYLGADPVTVKVLPDAVPSASLTAEPTDALKQLILDKAAEKVKSCASNSGNMDSSCPYQVRSTQLAKMEVTSTPTGFSDFSLGYFRTTKAVITVTPNPTSWNQNPSAEAVTFQLSGKFSFTGSDTEPTIDFQYAY